MTAKRLTLPHYLGNSGVYKPLTEGVHFHYTTPGCDTCLQLTETFPLDAYLDTAASGRVYYRHPIVIQEPSTNMDLPFDPVPDTEQQTPASVAEMRRRYVEAAAARRELWKAKQPKE